MWLFQDSTSSQRLLLSMVIFSSLLALALAEEDMAQEEEEDAAPGATEEEEEEEDPLAGLNIKNKEQMPKGTKKLSFKPPQLTEDQEKLNWMPDEMKCDGCLAVSYQLHLAFARGHLNHENNPKWKLSEGDIIERTENVCKYKVFEQYGISAEDGRNRIKGPGVFARAGISQMGGRTPFRLMEMCLQYLDLDEYVIYEKWLEIEKDMFKLQEYLCIENAKVCRLQTPEEAKALKKKLKEDEAREKESGDNFEAAQEFPDPKPEDFERHDEF